MNISQIKEVINVDNQTIYLSLSPSILVTSRKVCIEDIATIFCANPDIRFAVQKIELFTFQNDEQDQAVITVLALIQKISLQFKNVHIESIGNTETVIYYKNLKASTKRKGYLKSGFLMLLAFFGTSYSIMSYNGDVGAIDLLNNLYTLFTGDISTQALGSKLGILGYCLGLFIGMLVFFNHGLNHKLTDDPTPLQVQMRLYERDVNDAITVDSSRHKKTIDVD